MNTKIKFWITICEYDIKLKYGDKKILFKEDLPYTLPTKLVVGMSNTLFCT